MAETLFPVADLGDFLLEMRYDGPSFQGQMELGLLEKELAGLSVSLRLLIQSLSKQKRIDFSISDIQIFIEAFEKGSFRKRVKLLIKGIEKHPATSQIIATTLLSILSIVIQHHGDEVKRMSPELVLQIGDEVKTELLKDPHFIQSIAAVVSPLDKEKDELVLTKPDTQNLVISASDKEEFLKLTDSQDEVTIEAERFEVIRGKVTRVDLDATKNHIGFKVEDRGTTIPCTLVEKVSQEEMRSLLGQWVEITGTSTSLGKLRTHVDIATYSIIQAPTQTEISF